MAASQTFWSDYNVPGSLRSWQKRSRQSSDREWFHAGHKARSVLISRMKAKNHARTTRRAQRVSNSEIRGFRCSSTNPSTPTGHHDSSPDGRFASTRQTYGCPRMACASGVGCIALLTRAAGIFSRPCPKYPPLPIPSGSSPQVD